MQNPFANVYTIYLEDHALPYAADPYWYQAADRDGDWTANALSNLYRSLNEYLRNQNNGGPAEFGWPRVFHNERRIVYYTRNPAA